MKTRETKTMEEKILETLLKDGKRSLSEASYEAYGYVTAWIKGEVEPELISDLTGMTMEELRRARK